VAVGFGSSENIDKLGKYQDDKDIPWICVEGPNGMAREFGVRVQSTKFGIGSDGVVLFEGGYGSKSAETWTELLSSLAQDG
jgi:hypothetical protein